MSTNNYPIVLAHGIARFDELRRLLFEWGKALLADRNKVPDRTHYFRRIKSHLRDHNIEAFHATVSWASDVSVRGKELADNIRKIIDDGGYEKVHIIGHSMGGLDSRYMIVHEGMADKVASLTTIGTPHLGTSYAVHGLEHGGEKAIKVLKKLVDLDAAGFLNLTPDVRQKFNEEAENAEAKNGVEYHVYASWQERARLRNFLRHPWDIIHAEEGRNDGLVSVKSQMWTAELVADDGTRKKVHQHDFPVSADHSNEIGWWDINEVEGGRWWYPGVLNHRREYEAKIRDVYLQIAQEVRGQK